MIPQSLLAVFLLAGATLCAHGSDFETRRTAPGVVRSLDLDSTQEVEPHLFGAGDGRIRGTVDTAVKASGAGSLRFEIPSNSPANSSGSFWSNFMDDMSLQFGEGQEFYVQWRQRFSPEMLRAFRGGNGWKQIIIGEGDQPGLPTAWSCTELELVIQQDTRYMGPSFYHSCGRFISIEFHDGTQWRLQHQGPPYCYYPDDPDKGCYPYFPNEWMTFQIHVKIGTWNKANSRIRFWAAREGHPSVLIYDTDISPGGFTLYNTAGTNPNAKYGKLWLLTYNTNKDPSETHAPAYTWYDELIISRSRIPDPTASGDPPPQDSVAPSAPKNLRVE